MSSVNNTESNYIELNLTKYGHEHSMVMSTFLDKLE